jgi:hypothetical protein
MTAGFGVWSYGVERPWAGVFIRKYHQSSCGAQAARSSTKLILTQRELQEEFSDLHETPVPGTSTYWISIYYSLALGPPNLESEFGFLL